MTNKRRGIVGLAITALIGGAVIFWGSDDPDRGRTAHADVVTTSMGAAPTPQANPYLGMAERFEQEKKAAPDSDLPTQF